MPRAGEHDIGITWVGHSTFLLQIGGRNLLTDPHWSPRASPTQLFGPSRLTEPGITFAQLPPIDGVLLSHDHYDHLDATTVRRIAKTYPGAHWVAPLGHAGILRSLGVRHLTELDWWQATSAQGIRVVATPAQHWTRRIGSPQNSRLWSSYVIDTGKKSVYFAGDSGYCPCFHEIGERLGPFEAALLPIGAYEPRWFMKHAHMNPEEAVQAFRELKARRFVPMHWAAFRLTDEDPLEPPRRVREVWRKERLPEDDLHVLALGETLRL